jgi:hypothetical protein
VQFIDTLPQRQTAKTIIAKKEEQLDRIRESASQHANRVYSEARPRPINFNGTDGKT